METNNFVTVAEETNYSLDTDYEYFKREFAQMTTINLSLYKEKQMKRRINTLIQRKGLAGYAAFLSLLKANSKELLSFVDYITINVTEFFRTPEHWRGFEAEVLEKLVHSSSSRLKIWSCASSTGEEPYSLAMSMAKLTDLGRIQIVATDLDNTVLNKARQGLYDEKSLAQVPQEFRERFFTKKGNLWQISDELKRCIEFRKLDLLQDAYPMDCDVIVCRNILIYFTEEAKEMIYEKFKNSLKPNGYLFTGNTEQIIYYKATGYKKIKSYIYQK